MSEIYLMCRYDGKTHRKTIQAKHNNEWYIKHCPRTTRVITDTWVGVHPEMLDQLARDIAFMDRNDLVESGFRSPIVGLRHKMSSSDGEWGFNPYSYRGGENNCSFDHTTVWRQKGERWPQLVLTEPYGFSDEEKENCEDICENSGYRYKHYLPSEKSLWNSGCHMVFWWHKDFYEPDLKTLRG